MAIFDWLFGHSTAARQDHRGGSDPSDARTVGPDPTPVRPAFGHADRVPEGDFRFIALDVETACSDAASICQIGLACVQADDRIQTFSMLVNPRTRFDPFNIRLHGIGPEHVADAPNFADALHALLPLLVRHHLIQHSNFDKQAMNAACRSWGIAPPNLRWSDSVIIARKVWPELKGNGGHGLANLKRRLNLRFHHHDAGEDARAAAMVVQHAERHLSMPFEDLIKPVAARRSAPEANPAGPLAGTVVVFTGSLAMPRGEATRQAADAGMSVRTGVTRQTTHLVVGDQDLTALAGHAISSKHRKAMDMQANGHPIRIIGESNFRAMMAAC